MRRITSKSAVISAAVTGNGQQQQADAVVTIDALAQQAAAVNADAQQQAAKLAAQQAQQQQQAAAVADAGSILARTLKSDIARRTLMSAVGSVKRADLATAAADPHGRAVERVTAAKLADLARTLADAADAIATMADASYRTLKSVNVGTRMGSTSALALLLAVADASSKSDALAQFAAE